MSASDIPAAFKKQVECKEDEVSGLARGKSRLKGGEIRCTVMVESDDLAVDDGVREVRPGAGNFGKLVRPIKPLSRPQFYDAIFNNHLYAIAVELDLMAPSAPGWRTIDELAQGRLDKVGYLA